MNRKRLAVWAGVALVAALNVYAYNFQQGDIITYNYSGSAAGTRYYNVFDVNMNYQTNITIGPWSSTGNNIAYFTPELAIATDGLRPCFWVAYGGTNAAGTFTNLMLRRYDSPTSWTDIVSTISVADTCAYSNQCCMARGRDKFYIQYMAWETLSTNYYTNRGGGVGNASNVTMRVHHIVSYNFRNSTWGTPFMLLTTNSPWTGTNGMVDQNADNTYFPGDHCITAGFNLWQMGYLAASNQLVISYDSGSWARYAPDSATPWCWVTNSVAGLPPSTMCSNLRGIGTFSATQLMCVSISPVGAAIWNPYDSTHAYQVMPGVGYGGVGVNNISIYQIIRLANGQLLTGAGLYYLLCDPVTGNYTVTYCLYGAAGGFQSFAQITWPAKGTVVTTR